MCALSGPQFPYVYNGHQLSATAYTYWFHRAVKYQTLRVTAVSLLVSPSQNIAPINYPPSLLHWQTPSQHRSTVLFIPPHPTESLLFVPASLPRPFSLHHQTDASQEYTLCPHPPGLLTSLLTYSLANHSPTPFPPLKRISS